MLYRNVVVDGSYLVRRPWEAGGADACVGASIGCLLSLLDDYEPDRLVVMWEAPTGGKAHRQKLDGEYKARREPWSPDLCKLVDDLRLVYSWLGCWMGHCGAEADDAAATFVVREPGPHMLWSADKDWLQLVGPSCSILRDYSGHDRVEITVENIVEHTGLTPQQWTAYLAMAGDTSDGIVGVPKIGDKRARDIIAACPDILTLVEHGAREEAARQAAESNAEIVRWVEWVFDHAAQLQHALSLVVPFTSGDLTLVQPNTDAECAIAWIDAQGQSALVKRLERRGARDADPWESFSDPWDT